ncbi:mechanosensitive ion channel family protein [Sulfitobacter sp. M57]|uniref:mechanosensitive ion channel family protein n=1 Tax=unclassified Sulfitobacter TaxID=196795 RepID=UPI0023E16425|nr:MULTISPECIES: mechanosensitive ion channel family protein [unclassified Sulfitobacter]MDF3415938.1 mechanosensitive ion channel family protein [Sulfitobacter sp. KE5]MDF3423418.1 mechanosensitive ion channel family protein [Sulfitobacter sp. KE43]MDF3434484.1 mechanosensitive ion channel family protein [Sulfitobacter sp. KE42]MDF3460124.1 mechanosensitive ion channel family protein [Sulfitobacter sp. S74]MDF3464022.1 mechanosensitive ion channel family protein [Sulfitobacter sp. Ks18]
MRLIILLSLLIGLLLGPLSGIASAQGISFLTAPQAQEKSAEAKIEDIMQQAAENGVGVVVIDREGNLLQQEPEETPVDASEGFDGSALMALQDNTVRFRAALIDRLVELPASFNEVLYILRAASPTGTLVAFGEVLGYSLLLFAVGVLFEREIYGKRMMRHIIVPIIRENPVGYSEKMPFLVLRFLAGVGGIIVSMTVAYVIGLVIFGQLEDSALQFTATLVNTGYFTCRFVSGLWRMILSPYLAQYRVPALSDRDANRLYNWLWILAVFDICTMLFGFWIAELGLNYDVYAFLSSIMSAVIVLLNILMVLINRRAISRALRSGQTVEETGMATRVLSQIWAPIVILYVLFAWFQLTYDLVLGNPNPIPLIAGAYGILISIIVVYGVINYLIERSFSRARALRRMNEVMAEEDAQEQALEAAEQQAVGPEEMARLTQELEETRAEEEAARKAIAPRHQLNSFEGLARRVAGILAFVAGTYAFFYIWDNDSAEMVESAADRLLDIMVIMFFGYIIYHAFRIWIDTKIREEAGDQEEGELGDEGGGTSASRLATLLPLFRNFMLIVVVVTIVLIVLMQVGINVGPLFAGAGIVGVAVGFGSQALVRDIFAGAFFLFDDAFRKGEYLDVGGVKGTVEKISVRSFQLRHHLGALHTIPFGELQVMTNYSRDWVIMKLPLRVTYDTDVERVRKLIKKLGQELLEDPVIGPDFIQPLKSQGVIEMQDSAMIIRVKFMTKPGDQWVIRKRIYQDIRALFEREGIKFAHREVTVRLADGKVEELSEEERSTITAAAQASIEEEMLEGGAEPGGDDR